MSSDEIEETFQRCPEAAMEGAHVLLGTRGTIRAVSARGDWAQHRFDLDQKWSSYALEVTPERGFVTLDGKLDQEWPNARTELLLPGGDLLLADVMRATWAPDERSVALLIAEDKYEHDNGPWQLHWRRVDEGVSRRLADDVTGGVFEDYFRNARAKVSFSPDGAQLAYRQVDSLYLVPSYDAEPMLLVEQVGDWSWSYGDGECSLAHALGAERVVLYSAPCEPPFPDAALPTVPGCSYNRARTRLVCTKSGSVFVTAADGSARVDLGTASDGWAEAGWIGDDRLFYWLDGALHYASADGSADRMVAVVPRLGPVFPLLGPDVRASSDGRYVAFRTEAELFILGSDGTSIVRVPSREGVAGFAFH